MLSENPNSPIRDAEPSPLSNPSHWPTLIEGVRPEAILVLIAGYMGKGLREYCEPEDIWQETLARAWSAREAHHWQGSAAFRTWLLKIALDCIREMQRRIASPMRGDQTQVSILHGNSTGRGIGERMPGVASASTF